VTSCIAFAGVLYWFLTNLLKMGACFSAGAAVSLREQPNPAAAATPRYDDYGQRVFGDEVNAARLAAGDHAHRMKESFEKSQSAFQHNDKALAKKLSEQGNKEKALMEAANNKAVMAILGSQDLANNDTIDLHGLYVKEAVDQTLLFVNRAVKRRLPRLFIITGQGHHSQVHDRSPVREAILELSRKHGWHLQPEPHNPGKFALEFPSPQ
jgi:DNA-nicking Smr family endonuclease